MDDTVEKNIDGMVQSILEADKQRQEAELVGPSSNSRFQSDRCSAGSYEHRSKACELGSEERSQQEACPSGEEHEGGHLYPRPSVAFLHFICLHLTRFSGTRLSAETNDASKDIASALDARAAAEESDSDNE